MMVFLVSLNGCSQNQGYTIKYNRVIYSESTDNQEKPTINIKLEGVNPQNFKIINEKYGKYENDIYFRGIKILNPNPLSLNDGYVKEQFESARTKKDWRKATAETTSKDGYVRKNNNIYWNDIDNENKRNYFFVVPQADVDTFMISQQDPTYGKDRNYVYKLYKMPEIIKDADTFSFEILGFQYGKDLKNAYYYHMKISDAHVPSFQAIGHNYAKDSKQAYYRENAIKDIDPASFKAIGFWYAKDKNGVYCEDKKIPKSDPATFTFLKDKYSAYSKDKNSVYWFCQKIENADPQTFQVEIDGEAKDKNYQYKDGNKI